MNESAVLFGTYSIKLIYAENKGSEMNSDNCFRFDVPSITQACQRYEMKLQEMLFVGELDSQYELRALQSSQNEFLKFRCLIHTLSHKTCS